MVIHALCFVTFQWNFLYNLNIFISVFDLYTKQSTFIGPKNDRACKRLVSNLKTTATIVPEKYKNPHMVYGVLGALYKYLRQLPEPLCGPYQPWIDAMRLEYFINISYISTLIYI